MMCIVIETTEEEQTLLAVALDRSRKSSKTVAVPRAALAHLVCDHSILLNAVGLERVEVKGEAVAAPSVKRRRGQPIQVKMKAAPLAEDAMISVDGLDSTLADFFRENADGIGEEERASIRCALAERGVYEGGGGAGAEFTIRRIDHA